MCDAHQTFIFSIEQQRGVGSPPKWVYYTNTLLYSHSNNYKDKPPSSELCTPTCCMLINFQTWTPHCIERTKIHPHPSVPHKQST